MKSSLFSAIARNVSLGASLTALLVLSSTACVVGDESEEGDFPGEDVEEIAEVDAETQYAKSYSFGSTMTVSNPTYTCNGWYCTCTGTKECNDMFTNGCDGRPGGRCDETTGVCYCW